MATLRGGASLRGQSNLSRILGEIAGNVSKAASVQIGFLSDATYPDGTSVPMVAAIQEFGAPNKGIPPRPFFRQMIAGESGEWPEAVAKALKGSGYDAAKALDQVGAAIAGDLRKSIVAAPGPDLSPITVMLRGMRGQKRFRGLAFYKLRAIAAQRVAKGQTTYGASTKALIDTGHMSNSVDHRVD